MKVSKLTVVVLFGCSTWLGVGCAVDTVDSTVESDVTIQALTEEVAQRDGAYNATVRLEGTGCPSDSYDVSFDGDFTYTFDFADYRASIAAGENKSEAECKIVIDYRSRAGIQFRLGEFTHTGDAELAAGTSLKQVSKYKFPGLDEKIKAETNITGPFNSSYGVEDYALSDWSACSKRDNVKIVTRYVVKNSPTDDAAATVNANQIVSKLEWRNCQL